MALVLRACPHVPPRSTYGVAHPVGGPHRLGLDDGLLDPTQIAVEVHRPLVQVARG